MRITHARATVLRLVAASAEPIDVHGLVRASRAMRRPPVLTTIYRAVRDLTHEGVLIELGGRDRRRRYAMAEVPPVTFRMEGQPHRLRVEAADLSARILQEARRLGLDVTGCRISIALVRDGSPDRRPSGTGDAEGEPGESRGCASSAAASGTMT